MEGPHAKAKVCLVGANTGCKTSLLRPHVRDEFDDRYIETLGTKVSKRELKVMAPVGTGQVTVDLLVWDIMSQMGFRELLKEAYMHGCKGILAVTDMTRRHTLHDLDAWIRTVEHLTGPIPIAIIGANRDRAANLEVTEEDVAGVARQHGAPCFFEPSLSGESVEAALRYLAEAHLRSVWR